MIRRQLGAGGMGVVYLAEHALLGTPRVVKLLLPEWTQHPTVVQRFVNEARAAAAIQHRNIIQIHDCAQLPDGRWYIVMDYVQWAARALAGFVQRAVCRCTSRCASWARSRMASKPRIAAASSIAISSPTTSC